MNIQEKIKNWIKETLKIEENFVLSHPKNIKNGDYSFFSPVESANEFDRVLSENKIPEIEKIEVIGGFMNFYLSKEFFVKSIRKIVEQDENCGKSDLFEGQKVLIDHTQPNPFKEFHIGHLMNNAIGESLVRIIKTNGADVTAVGYHGDIGLHVAKAIWGLIRNSPAEISSKTLGEAYAKGASAYEENEDSKNEILEINKKIYEKSDPEINSLYEDGKEISLKYFEIMYKRLDSHFKHHFYESEVEKIGKELVLKNVGKIFEESEGAIIFRGENFEPKTHTRVFINSKGLPVYEAKEVGLAKLKKEKYEYNESITVTANEQDAFFNVVEVAIGEIFPEIKGKLKHISHGMLKLPTGKMSSRTGNIITAESLIDQVKEKVFKKIKDRKFSRVEEDEVAEIIAIGAIKYSILKQAIGGDIVFDFDKSISFEGSSGPYLQYSYTRAKSVLRKALVSESMNMSLILPKNWETTELEKYLYRFPEIIEKAGREYAPHHIVTYLTELASIFNSFYAKEKIIDENDPSSPYKISLTQAVADILKSGLFLLGIKVPERM